MNDRNKLLAVDLKHGFYRVNRTFLLNRMWEIYDSVWPRYGSRTLKHKFLYFWVASFKNLLLKSKQIYSKFFPMINNGLLHNSKQNVTNNTQP
jgi:hypothetical protein